MNMVVAVVPNAKIDMYLFFDKMVNKKELESVIDSDCDNIFIFRDYALIKTDNHGYKRVPDNGTITSESIDDIPGLQFVIYNFHGHSIIDYREPLTKRWTAELRIAQLISRNIYKIKSVYISDQYIIFNIYGFPLCHVSNNSIYYLNDRDYLCAYDVTLFSTDLVPCMNYSRISDTMIDKPHVTIAKKVTFVDTDQIYTEIINCRARGIHYITDLCDVKLTFLFFDISNVHS